MAAYNSDSDDQFYGGEEEENVKIRLDECGNCGRKFNVDVLNRHVKICTNLKSRKAFDSSKQRLEGIEKLAAKNKTQQFTPKPSKKKADWRRKHEEFINTIRSARKVTAALKDGKELPPPPKPTFNPDYIQCEYCNRRFSESAAERHINFCKEQKSRLPKQGSASKFETRKEQQAKRTQYRPPVPGSKKKSVSSPVKARVSSGHIPTREKKGSFQKMEHSEVVREEAPNGRLKKRVERDASPHHNNNNNNTRYNNKRGSDGEGDRKTRSGKTRNGDPKWFEDMKRAESKKDQSKYSDNHYEREDSLDGISSPGRRNSAKVGVVRPSSHSTTQMATAREEAKLSSGRRKLATFCHDCGTRYPITTAKFCCECGIRRMALT